MGYLIHIGTIAIILAGCAVEETQITLPSTPEVFQKKNEQIEASVSVANDVIQIKFKTTEEEKRTPIAWKLERHRGCHLTTLPQTAQNEFEYEKIFDKETKEYKTGTHTETHPVEPDSCYTYTITTVVEDNQFSLKIGVLIGIPNPQN